MPDFVHTCSFIDRVDGALGYRRSGELSVNRIDRLLTPDGKVPEVYLMLLEKGRFDLRQ